MNEISINYLGLPYCSMETPFEEMGFAQCHKKFKDIEMFNVLCDLQKQYKKQKKIINYLDKRLSIYEPWRDNIENT